jgi:hypothetical protein
VALERIIHSLAGVRGRKAVILVSEGFIHDTNLEGFRRVSRASFAANANLYFLNARGIEGIPSAMGPEEAGPTTLDDPGDRPAQIEDISSARRYGSYEADGSNALALDSGGFSIQTNDLSKGLQRIVRESRTYYLLGYEPTNRRRDGKFRKIEVEVKRPGVSVRARKGYYAPSDDPKRAAPETIDPALRAALSSPFHSPEIPLRMTVYLLGPAGQDATRVLLAAEADPAAVGFEERRGRFSNELQSIFQVSSRDSEPVHTKERLVELDLLPAVRARMDHTWIPVAGSFDLPKGVYQAMLVVREQRTGRVGTVRHSFEVPTTGDFRISTPILTDTFMARSSEADGPAPVPLARRRFFSGGELAFSFDVFGAGIDPQTRLPRVALRYGVRRADGPEPTLRSQGIGTGPEGELRQKIRVPLRGVPPGEYEIVLEVEDQLSGQVVERREAFEVSLPGASPTADTEGPPAGAAR